MSCSCIIALLLKVVITMSSLYTVNFVMLISKYLYHFFKAGLKQSDIVKKRFISGGSESIPSSIRSESSSKSSDKSISRTNAKDSEKNGTNDSELRKDIKNKFSDDKQDGSSTSSHQHSTVPAHSSEALQHDKVSGSTTSTSGESSNPSKNDKLAATNLQKQQVRADSSSTSAQLETLRKSYSTPNFIKYGLSQSSSRRVSQGQKRKLDDDIAEVESGDVTPQVKKHLVDNDNLDQRHGQENNESTKNPVETENAVNKDLSNSNNTNSISSIPVVEDNNIKEIVIPHPRPPGESIS